MEIKAIYAFISTSSGLIVILLSFKPKAFSVLTTTFKWQNR